MCTPARSRHHRSLAVGEGSVGGCDAPLDALCEHSAPPADGLDKMLLFPIDAAVEMRSRWQSGARARSVVDAVAGRLAPRLGLVAKPPGSRGEGTSAWIWPRCTAPSTSPVRILVLANKHLVVNTDPILIASLGSLFGTIVAWTLVGCGRVEAQDAAHDVAVGDVRPAHRGLRRGRPGVRQPGPNVRVAVAGADGQSVRPRVTAAALVTFASTAPSTTSAPGRCASSWGDASSPRGGRQRRGTSRTRGSGWDAWWRANRRALRLCGVHLLSSSSTVKNNATTKQQHQHRVRSGHLQPGVQPTYQPRHDALRRPLLLSPISLGVLALVYAFEWDGVRRAPRPRRAGNPLLLATGTFGFLANVAGLGVVQHGEPVTLDAVAVEERVVIALAVVAYGDPVTVRAVAGHRRDVQVRDVPGGAPRRRRRRRRRRVTAQRNLGGGGGGIVEGRLGGRQHGDVGVGVAPTGVGVDLGVGAMNGVVVGGGDGSMSASSSARVCSAVERTRGDRGVGSAKVEDGAGWGAKAGSSKGEAAEYVAEAADGQERGQGEGAADS